MWGDRIAGVVLGLVLGVAIVAVFVFVFSEQTIDSASISQGGSAATGSQTGGGGGHARRHQGGGAPKPSSVTATVPVVGGAPPESGPAHVDADQGDNVTLTINPDGDVSVELIGYGITKTIPASTPTPISFKAARPGNFALINTATHIAVAQLRVNP
jgi:hypothetical protein